MSVGRSSAMRSSSCCAPSHTLVHNANAAPKQAARMGLLAAWRIHSGYLARHPLTRPAHHSMLLLTRRRGSRSVTHHREDHAMSLPGPHTPEHSPPYGLSGCEPLGLRLPAYGRTG